MDLHQQLVEYLARHPDARSCLGCLAEELGANRKRVEDAFRRIASERIVQKQYTSCPRCRRVKLVYWTERSATPAAPVAASARPEGRELRVGDLVKWRTGASDVVGRVVGFTTRDAGRHVIVRWLDDRLAPNPSTELLHQVERVEPAADR